MRVTDPVLLTCVFKLRDSPFIFMVKLTSNTMTKVSLMARRWKYSGTKSPFLSLKPRYLQDKSNQRVNEVHSTICNRWINYQTYSHTDCLCAHESPKNLLPIFRFIKQTRFTTALIFVLILNQHVNVWTWIFMLCPHPQTTINGQSKLLINTDGLKLECWALEFFKPWNSSLVGETRFPMTTDIVPFIWASVCPSYSIFPTNLQDLNCCCSLLLLFGDVARVKLMKPLRVLSLV